MLNAYQPSADVLYRGRNPCAATKPVDGVIPTQLRSPVAHDARGNLVSLIRRGRQDRAIRIIPRWDMGSVDPASYNNSSGAVFPQQMAAGTHSTPVNTGQGEDVNGSRVMATNITLTNHASAVE